MTDSIKLPPPASGGVEDPNGKIIGRDLQTGRPLREYKREPRLVPGNGGTETPVTARNGRKYLWCWDINRTGTFPGDHVYVDMSTDMAITPEEHQQIFG